MENGLGGKNKVETTRPTVEQLRADPALRALAKEEARRWLTGDDTGEHHAAEVARFDNPNRGADSGKDKI